MRDNNRLNLSWLCETAGVSRSGYYSYLESEDLRQQREQALADFRPLHQALTAAQAESDKRSAAAEALYHTLSSNEQGILLEVRRFAPAAFDIPTADQHDAFIRLFKTLKLAHHRTDML